MCMALVLQPTRARCMALGATAYLCMVHDFRSHVERRSSVVV